MPFLISCRWPRLPRQVCAKAINAIVIGLYYLVFFTSNSVVGKISGFLETWPTTNFWLLHAAFATGAGLCFVIFKFFISHHLEAEGNHAAV